MDAINTFAILFMGQIYTQTIDSATSAPKVIGLSLDQTKEPSVAVCLAAFNGMRYLKQQTESIFAQTGVNLTLFVSVDSSDDGTEEWVANLQAADSRVVLLPCGQKFGGAAVNFFRMLREIDFSQFDYISFADQDDIWQPKKLQRAVECLRAQDADGYSSDVIAFWESGRSQYIKKSYPQEKWDYLFESAGPGCTFVITRGLAMHIQNVLRDRLSQSLNVGLHDWFTYAFARANGYKWVIDDYASLMYRQHEGNQVGVNVGFAAVVWRAKQVLSGWGLNQARLIAQLVGADQQRFVNNWCHGGRLAMLGLGLQAPRCRRRPRDKVLFALSCLALSVVGWKSV
ncbi:MAG: glycosyltransferase [Rhodoferax sp.]